MSLEEKVGYYKTREGKTAHITTVKYGEELRYNGTILEGDGTLELWCAEGKYFISGENNDDLIEYLGEELPANPPVATAPEVKAPVLEASPETTFTTVKPESQNNPLENMLVERAEKERRDNIAIEAMKALIRNRAHQSVDDLCDMAYAFADSMIERSKE